MNRYQRRGELEALFLRSHLALCGQCPSVEDAYAWYMAQRGQPGFSARIVPLADVSEWRFCESPLKMSHSSGRFFSIEGLRVETSFGPVKSWDQPIINQPEIGILGFLTRKFQGVFHFLVQAKREPGNINVLQLAPTVQATWSNYTRVHKGKNTPYLEYFVNSQRSRKLLDQLQSEQASRFLGKRNRNIIVEATDEVEVREGYRWLTLGQIKALMAMDNVVNMDARSVLSLIPLACLDGCPEQPLPECWGELDDQAKSLCLSTLSASQEHSSMDEIIAWLNTLKTRYPMKSSPAPLDRLRRWVLDEDGLHHEDDMHFRVIGLDVSASCREMSSWRQPILHHQRPGLRGFLMRPINGVLHFLAKAFLEPGGHDGMSIGPSISCSDAKARQGGKLAPKLLDVFLDPAPGDVYLRCMQSEEGGRFHHFENEYVFLNAPQGMPHPGPGYRWMTLGQLLRLARHGHLTIEARNLLACLSVLPRQALLRRSRQEGDAAIQGAA